MVVQKGIRLGNIIEFRENGNGTKGMRRFVGEPIDRKSVVLKKIE